MATMFLSLAHTSANQVYDYRKVALRLFDGAVAVETLGTKKLIGVLSPASARRYNALRFDGRSIIGNVTLTPDGKVRVCYELIQYHQQALKHKHQAQLAWLLWLLIASVAGGHTYWSATLS